MDIQSSRRNNFEIEVFREIEPGVNTVLDMHINTEKKDDGSTKKQIRIASMKDMDFIYDEIGFEQKKITPDNDESLNLDFEISQVKKEKYISVPIKAYSHCWPYVAFSGIKQNALFIVSAFNQDHIHRVRIKKIEPGSNFYIMATMITNSLDLMIITKENDTYTLYKINLDNCNHFEIDAENFDNEEFFRVIEIMSFNASDVQDKEFK